MKKEPLKLEHKTLIEPLFQGLDLELSEYSFANLFLFRDLHRYELIQGDDLYIQGVSYDGIRYLMPCSERAARNWASALEFAKEVECLFPIPESWLSFFTNSSYKEQDSDYLYSVESMATYKGRHLSKKRNLLKQFQEQYEVRQVPLQEANENDIQDLVERWKEDSSADTKELLEAIRYQQSLGLEGWVFYSNSQAIGILIGEPLNRRVYVIHFAKADTSYKGVYQYMYHAYAEALLERKFLLLNLEQDLGSPELRQSKHSYQPFKIAPKWRISIH